MSKLKLFIVAAILSVAVLTIVRPQLSQADALANQALTASEINQLPGVEDSNLSTTSEVSLLGGYGLYEIHEEQKRSESQNNHIPKEFEFYTIEGFVREGKGPNSQSSYVSQELYRYADSSQAQAAMDWFVTKAVAKYGSQPLQLETKARDISSGTLTSENGVQVYWSVGTRNNVLVIATVYGDPSVSYPEEIFKALSKGIFR
jgi:hypothetical protein